MGHPRTEAGRPLTRVAADPRLVPWRGLDGGMMHQREPVLDPVRILDLRPTQMTVGMREVEAKRAHWRSVRRQEAGEFLGRHMVPVVLGPGRRHYIIDHHHLVLALHAEGVEAVLVTVVANLARLDRESFWFFLDNSGMSHPYDADGVRQGPAAIPKSITGLIDDPYRSLAGELRRAGGFSKETTPFSEFLWADFLRRRIKRKRIEKSFQSALEKALILARSAEAGYLPGWCGPSSD